MNETIQCPYGSACPQVVSVEGEIKSISDRMDLQQKYLVEKIETIGADVKSIQQSLGKDLDLRINEKIDAKFNERIAKITRWLIVSILGNGGLTVLISLLVSST